jgi:hypothetical protein
MVKQIVVTKSYIKLVSDDMSFYIGAKHFDNIIKAIEMAKTLPEVGMIVLKIEEPTEEEAEILEEETYYLGEEEETSE